MSDKKKEPLKLEGKEIEYVNEFTCLGAVVSKEGGGGKDMGGTLNKARTVVTIE